MSTTTSKVSRSSYSTHRGDRKHRAAPQSSVSVVSYKSGQGEDRSVVYPSSVVSYQSGQSEERKARAAPPRSNLSYKSGRSKFCAAPTGIVGPYTSAKYVARYPAPSNIALPGLSGEEWKGRWQALTPEQRADALAHADSCMPNYGTGISSRDWCRLCPADQAEAQRAAARRAGGGASSHGSEGSVAAAGRNVARRARSEISYADSQSDRPRYEYEEEDDRRSRGRYRDQYQDGYEDDYEDDRKTLLPSDSISQVSYASSRPSTSRSHKPRRRGL